MKNTCALYMTVAALIAGSWSTSAYAKDVVGSTVTVGPGDGMHSWYVRNSGTLKGIEGSKFRSIDIRSNSRLFLQGSQVELGLVDAYMFGVRVGNGSSAQIDKSQIIHHSGTALALAGEGAVVGPVTPAAATVTDSWIEGTGVGASVANNARLEVLQQSNIIGRTSANREGVGIAIYNGQASVSDSKVIGDHDGVMFQSDWRGNDWPGPDELTVSNSTIEGGTGSAIRVKGSKNSVPLNINIVNGSKLSSGSGTLLMVESGTSGGGIALLSAENSTLQGDIIVENGGYADVALRGKTQLTGRIEGLQKLAIADSAEWTMTDRSNVDSLTMQGGKVDMAGSPFNTLTVGTLEGNGTFSMRANIGESLGDQLVVSGTATGHHNLHIANSGKEPTTGTPLVVVRTGGGDAAFDLTTGEMDFGTYKYGLQNQGTDWLLVGTQKVTPSTETVVGVASTAPTVWYAEADMLQDRMGDVRRSVASRAVAPREHSFWMRSFGRRYDVRAGVDLPYSLKQSGFTLGFDTPVPMQGDNHLLIGVFGGYSKSSLDFSLNSKAYVDSYSGGAYATWYDDEGWYAEATLKANRFSNNASVQMTDGSGAGGRYSNFGVGAQVEAGRRLQLGSRGFIEPFAQVSAFHANKANYTLSNGLTADADSVQSKIGRIGMSVGFDSVLRDGTVIQPYLKVAVAHEFEGQNYVRVNNDYRFNNDLSGTRGEIGAGVVAQFLPALQMHVNFDYAKSSKIEQKWGVNFGLRYSF